jgi:hypothetical protein
MEEWREQILSIVSALTISEDNFTNSDTAINDTMTVTQIDNSVQNKLSDADQKLRFNYASAECGSKVLSSNSGYLLNSVTY